MILCRFTRDLRLDDHAALAAAAEHGEVLAVLVIDDETSASMRRSPRRAAYYTVAVASLDEALRERGSALVVRRGEAAHTLLALTRETGARGVVWSARYDGAGARADATLRAALEEAGLVASCVDDAPAVAPEQIERSDEHAGYRAFVPYFERWRDAPIGSYDVPLLLRFATANVRSEPLPSLDEFGAAGARVAFPIGATALHEFLQNAARSYATARRVPADDATSKLSPALSFGTLSLRTAVRATHNALDNPFLLNEERRSLRLFLRSLATRDFFLQLAHFHPESDDAPLQERMRGFAFANGHPALDAWRRGATGFPLVDAGMRQLNETGWMHPQVRAVTASFLCFDLGLDWRIGRRLWDELAIEHDPAIATGNWQWIAGVGADLVQHPRIYNPHRRLRSIDPDGRYVRRWVRELAHRPVVTGGEGAPMLPLYDGHAYPAPVVDHAQAARAFLQRYREYLASSAEQGSTVFEG